MVQCEPSGTSRTSSWMYYSEQCSTPHSMPPPPSLSCSFPQVCNQSILSGITWSDNLQVWSDERRGGMPEDILRSSYVSMPTRIASCIRSRGGSTE
ncbi:hypothetical protein TNCV_831691 [Trichonephila clavipes]|nr:hypothetical protein TNCV_831691 [Trichonephila clavipes]